MIGIGSGSITVHVESMATPAALVVVVKGAIHHGATLEHLILEDSSPLVIGIELLHLVAEVVGHGLHQQISLLVIAEELNCTQDIAALSTAAVHRIIHVLLLADVTHQPSHSIGLGLVIVALDILVEHIVPVKGDGGQCRQTHHIVERRNRRRWLNRIFPVIEHHRQ